jgi:predicted O-methyltransferase YrrM
MMSLTQLATALPRVHDRRSVTYGIDLRLAEFLKTHVSATDVTLETGSGLSTMVIAQKGVRRHISIQPFADEFNVLRDFSATAGIDFGCVETIVARSQDYLPTASLPQLDLILIDGEHTFPIPFLDWYYTADLLKVGGLMVVDDVDIATGTILAAFMTADRKWEQVQREEFARFAIYRKLEHPIHDGSWRKQQMLAATYPTASVELIRRRTYPRAHPVRLVAAAKRRAVRLASRFTK